MLDSAQFLNILAAESEHLVTISIFIDPDTRRTIETRLDDALTSDNFGGSTQAWNTERLLVVQEVLDVHLIPAAVKWTREFIREEVEDFLAIQYGGLLRNVRSLWLLEYEIIMLTR